MGRKLNTLKPKSGPGRKVRKQGVPEFKGFIDSDEDDKSKFSHRQQKRAKKRQHKAQEEAVEEAKRIKLSEESVDKENNSLKKLPSAEKITKSDKSNSDIDEDMESDVESQESIDGALENDQDNPGDSESDSGSDIFRHVKNDEFDSDEGERDDVDDEEEEEAVASDYDDDDEDENDTDEDEEDNNDDDDDVFTRLEKQSQKLEKKRKIIETESQAELLESHSKVCIEIPSLEEVKEELLKNPDMQNISHRIKDVFYVLENFRERREGTRSRQEYVNILELDLCAYYSYNSFLIKKLKELFPLSELQEFLEANEVPRPVTIRTNALKTRRKMLAQSLINQGANVDILNWSSVGLVAYSAGSVPLGATMEYLAGYYILQGASSFLPVVALAPKENEKVLDMCAAPGGKSTHIAALMKNTGVLFCNDFNRGRTNALQGNFHRMGIRECLITCFDGRKFSKMKPHYFDRVLVDAPCSGTGIISKDEHVKMGKEERDMRRCSHLQKELILSGIDSVDALSSTGGYICYSTCSILIEENEEVIQYALNKRNVELVPTGLTIGREGFVNFKGKKFHPSMKETRRIYPHLNNMDGFFVAKLKKTSNEIPTLNSSYEKLEEVENNLKKAEIQKKKNREVKGKSKIEKIKKNKRFKTKKVTEVINGKWKEASNEIVKLNQTDKKLEKEENSDVKNGQIEKNNNGKAKGKSKISEKLKTSKKFKTLKVNGVKNGVINKRKDKIFQKKNKTS